MGPPQSDNTPQHSADNSDNKQTPVSPGQGTETQSYQYRTSPRSLTSSTPFVPSQCKSARVDIEQSSVTWRCLLTVTVAASMTLIPRRRYTPILPATRSTWYRHCVRAFATLQSRTPIRCHVLIQGR